MEFTPYQRICIARRSQPIEELRRKMLKAGRRSLRCRYDVSVHSVEGGDWYMAQYHARTLKFRTETLLKAATNERLRTHNFCFLCSAMGTGPFNKETGLYAVPANHKQTCTLACPPPWISAGAPKLAGPSGRLP